MTIDPTNLLAEEYYSAGDESTLIDEENHVQLTNGDELTCVIRSLTFGELPDLEQELTNDPTFNKLVVISKLKKSALMGLYKNQDGVRTFYDIVPSDAKGVNYLLIFSYGETQPTKFTFQIESVWPVLG